MSQVLVGDAALVATPAAVVPSPVHEPDAPLTVIAGMEVSEDFFQQGDVLIERVAEDGWPKSEGERTALRKRDDRRLAVSATTGYSHEASDGTLYEVYSYGRLVEGELWLDVPCGTVIRHHEHRPVTLPPGKYRVFGVVEFDPFEAPDSIFAVRRVVD